MGSACPNGWPRGKCLSVRTEAYSWHPYGYIRQGGTVALFLCQNSKWAIQVYPKASVSPAAPKLCQDAYSPINSSQRSGSNYFVEHLSQDLDFTLLFVSIVQTGLSLRISWAGKHKFGQCLVGPSWYISTGVQMTEVVGGGCSVAGLRGPASVWGCWDISRGASLATKSSDLGCWGGSRPPLCPQALINPLGQSGMQVLSGSRNKMEHCLFTSVSPGFYVDLPYGATPCQTNTTSHMNVFSVSCSHFLSCHVGSLNLKLQTCAFRIFGDYRAGRLLISGFTYSFKEMDGTMRAIYFCLF